MATLGIVHDGHQKTARRHKSGWLMALQLVQEIETRAALAQRDLGVVKSHIAAKQRDVRLLQLTTSELAHLARDTNVYEGVGKM